MPSAYADKRKLTPRIHGQYLAPFRDSDARLRVLWALAKALTTSGPSLSRLWEARANLSGLPTLIVWGLADKVLPSRLLARLRQALPHAEVHALEGVGHWPQEEAPEQVAKLVDGFLPRQTGHAR